MANQKSTRWHERVRTRLTFAIVIAIIVPMLIFYLMSIEVAARAQRSGTEDDLDMAVQDATALMDELLERLSIGLIPSEYDPDTTTLSGTQLTFYLSFFLHRVPSIDDISFVTLGGKETARISRTQVFFAEQTRDFAGSDMLESIKAGKRYYGTPYLDEEGRRQMQVAIPDYNEAGRLDGALLADVSLRRVFQQVEMRSRRHVHLYVVDDDGIVIAHPDFALVLGRANLARIPVVAATHALPRGSRTRMMSYASIDGRPVFGLGAHTQLGWAFVAENPEQEAMIGVRDITWIFTIVFASAGLVGLVASLVIGSKATRSLLLIGSAARTIGEGDFARRVEERSHGELGDLEHNLNVMAAKLEEYCHHLERDMDLLNKKVAERTESLQRAYNDLQARDSELKRTQSALVQTEKLASLGQLVAGVIHEVNNPLAFVLNNVEVLKRDAAALAEISRSCHAALHAPDAAERERLLHNASDLAEKIDLEHTSAAVERLLTGSSEGLKQIRKIVSDLRDFSRAGEFEREPTDLNRSVETTLGMLAYELKRKQIRVTKHLGELPPVLCSPVKINQVLVNIIMNAVQAMDDEGRLWITTAVENGYVAIHVRDNGHGIPEEIMDRIFDPFFTTRPRGEGTGLGLSVSYGIIQEHHGFIDVASKPGEGAEFTIKLPIKTENKQ